VSGRWEARGASDDAAVRALFAQKPGFFGQGGAQDLVLRDRHQGLAGTYLRYQRTLGGLPVFGREVVARLQPGQGSFVVSAFNFGKASPTRVASMVDAGEAVARSRAAAVLKVPAASVQLERGIFPGDAGKPGVLAYRARATTAHGEPEIVQAAADGKLLAQRERRMYVDGTAKVYDPNAVAATGDLTLVDNDDATSPALDAARVPVTLHNLDGSGFLRGSFVDSRTKDETMRAQSATNAFDFTRNDVHFSEVMAYFHIDRVQTRIQALGFTNINNRAIVAIADDIPDDNSFYSPSDLSLHFGTGGVDDAEDADVVIHEYGHSVQDNQVPGWGGGDEGSMGEGFGDSLAGSFNTGFAPHLVVPECLAPWDATSYSSDSPPCLRRLDKAKHYPEEGDGEVHDDGEIWSAALWQGRTLVTADVMDKLVLEAHFMLGTEASFFQAAQAILDTDTALFAGAHVDTLRHVFIERGLLRTLSAPAGYDSVVSTVAVSVDNTRGSTGVYTDHLDESKTITQPGALALTVHFAKIQTEEDASCFEGVCDNIYLYDAAGNLYQILNGDQPNGRNSVQIPGDTVRIRLVTDLSVGKFGYHIDRVDVRGGAQGGPVDAGPPDAEPAPDAGPEAPDAMPVVPDAAPVVPDAAPATPDAAPVTHPDAGGGGGDDDGGCGCHVGGSGQGAAGGGAAGALLLLGAGVSFVRRRRARR
jgi:hypothetical protein